MGDSGIIIQPVEKSDCALVNGTVLCGQHKTVPFTLLRPDFFVLSEEKCGEGKIAAAATNCAARSKKT